MSKIKPLARRADIVLQEVDNETLIYDLRANKAFNLNETSALIWQLSDGNLTISEIAESLTKRLDSPITDEFVWLALEQLRKEKLIENGTQLAGLYEGVSRREMIRRVGLASMVALPLVSSLVAPRAVDAQTGVCAGACQCPNAIVNFCTPSGVGGTLICNPLSSDCRCRGPFGAPGSGTSPGQKTGNCAPGPT